MRNIAWGIIYNKKLIEARGIDESSAEVSKKQGWTVGTSALKRQGKKMVAITKTEKETRVYNGSFLPISLLFLAAVSDGEPKHWCGLQDGRPTLAKRGNK